MIGLEQEVYEERRGLPHKFQKGIAARILSYTLGIGIVLGSFIVYHNKAMANYEPELKGKIAFTSDKDGNPEIYVMDADGKNLKRLTNNPARDRDPSWSPDGKKIAFASLRDGNWEIYLMDANGTNPVNLTNHPAADLHPSWSPNGTKIAFNSHRDGNWEIYLMDTDGKNQTNLTNSPSWQTGPSWSPDGEKIAYTFKRPYSHYEVCIMDADGENQRNLTNHPIWEDHSPSWSPDGSKIAFISWKDKMFNPDIYVMNSDGNNQTRLTNSSTKPGSLSWSPDGRKIAFVSRDGNFNIYVMNADGKNPHRLTNKGDNRVFSFSIFSCHRNLGKISPEEEKQLHYLLNQKIGMGISGPECMDVKLSTGEWGGLLEDEYLTLLKKHRNKAIPILLEKLKRTRYHPAALLLGFLKAEEALPLLRQAFIDENYFYGFEVTVPDILVPSQYPHHYCYEAAIEHITGKTIEEYIKLSEREAQELYDRVKHSLSQILWDRSAGYVLYRLSPDVALDVYSSVFKARKPHDRVEVGVCFQRYFLKQGMSYEEVEHLLPPKAKQREIIFRASIRRLKEPEAKATAK